MSHSEERQQRICLDISFEVIVVILIGILIIVSFIERSNSLNAKAICAQAIATEKNLEIKERLFKECFK